MLVAASAAASAPESCVGPAASAGVLPAGGWPNGSPPAASNSAKGSSAPAAGRDAAGCAAAGDAAAGGVTAGGVTAGGVTAGGVTAGGAQQVVWRQVAWRPAVYPPGGPAAGRRLGRTGPQHLQRDRLGWRQAESQRLAAVTPAVLRRQGADPRGHSGPVRPQAHPQRPSRRGTGIAEHCHPVRPAGGVRRRGGGWRTERIRLLLAWLLALGRGYWLHCGAEGVIGRGGCGGCGGRLGGLRRRRRRLHGFQLALAQRCRIVGRERIIGVLRLGRHRLVCASRLDWCGLTDAGGLRRRRHAGRNTWRPWRLPHHRQLGVATNLLQPQPIGALNPLQGLRYVVAPSVENSRPAPVRKACSASSVRPNRSKVKPRK